MIHIVKRTVSVLSQSYFFFPVTGWQATVATVNPLGVQTIDAGGDFFIATIQSSYPLREDSSQQSIRSSIHSTTCLTVQHLDNQIIERPYMFVWGKRKNEKMVEHTAAGKESS